MSSPDILVGTEEIKKVVQEVEIHNEETDESDLDELLSDTDSDNYSVHTSDEEDLNKLMDDESDDSGDEALARGDDIAMNLAVILKIMRPKH